MSLVIVDYDAGNLRSVEKAFAHVGVTATVSRDPKKVSQATSLVLPGVGAFADCMANLKKYNLVDPLKNFIAEGKPFLGICVGYQLLFDKSEEHGDNEGLGILRGKCVRFEFDPSVRLKIPHMGWNQVRYQKSGKLFEGIDSGTDFYFVHSYYPVPEDDNIVTSSTDYGIKFASSIEKENIFATQFHPEKSQQAGLKLVRNFAKICGEL